MAAVRAGAGAPGPEQAVTGTVTRGTLISQAAVNATLGYAGSYTVVNGVQGTFTALPTVGQVIRQGQVLYRVDGSPVVLLYGGVPALPVPVGGHNRGGRAPAQP